jgi:hypothetical protein
VGFGLMKEIVIMVLGWCGGLPYNTTGEPVKSADLVPIF